MNNYIRFILISFLAAILFTGCSISHKLSSYDTTAEFYEDFNNVMRDRSVEAITKSDSIIIVDDGMIAENDTISIIHKKESYTPAIIPIKLISNIRYLNYDTDNITGFIQLKDGTVYEAAGITGTPDSMKFLNVNHYETKTPFHISIIKTVTYTEHWMAVPGGIVAGVLTGFAIGFLRPFPIDEGGHGASGVPRGREISVGNNVMVCSYLGGIVGAIVGYLIGFDYDYYPNL